MMLLNQRGIALPMALIAMSLISSLIVAFAMLAQGEPMIASNQAASLQARAVAESGLEQTIWALDNPAAPMGLPDVNGDAAAPYNGQVAFALGPDGAYTIAVLQGALVNQRRVVVTGRVGTGTGRESVKKIVATMMKLKKLDPPCVICAKGALEAAGNANIRSTANGCDGGTPPTTATVTTSTTTTVGSADIYGYGNNRSNEPSDYAQNVDPSTFDPFTFSRDDVEFLKSLAKANGTYYKGSVTFNSSNWPKDGIVFVDTTTGQPFGQNTPDSEAASVTINSNLSFRGWIIAEGSIRVEGGAKLTGLVYAMNDIATMGTSRIEGAIISENKKDSVATTIDATATGTTDIIYNCQAVRDGGKTLSTGWFVMPGSYREVEGDNPTTFPS